MIRYQVQPGLSKTDKILSGYLLSSLELPVSTYNVNLWNIFSGYCSDIMNSYVPAPPKTGKWEELPSIFEKYQNKIKSNTSDFAVFNTLKTNYENSQLVISADTIRFDSTIYNNYISRKNCTLFYDAVVTTGNIITCRIYI